MRIPLDYYRILGLPIQATNEQLRQAHRDRTLQLPRREYSDAAIAARKQLLDQAYDILSNLERRESYDANFLAKTYEAPGSSFASSDDIDELTLTSPSEESSLVDPHTPIIEVEDNQFIGALLVLQELGEYELVLKLGRTFLIGGNGSLKDGRYGDPSIAYSDIVLTVALACLELGREQWQQGQYENAAEALETGQQLLLREGLFAGVRGEIQSDLYRLRPYRVLELLASPETNVEDRQSGMELLEEMLQERGGIDGSENDQSGLTIDDFCASSSNYAAI
ncbi:MAG: J domain-containing protein [Leptolyngbyaceae cyanobacterium RU_5_1]|nr:J domain-containing protein [Leptolyngbyaceae cyanobacterium RU_5_1]